MTWKPEKNDLVQELNISLAAICVEMIPEILPSTSTAGEKRVFAALSKLPDDCLVYYEPVVRRRYPDFIVILPAVGVLIIEVKDWRLAELSNLTSDSITINRRGTETTALHPREQARRYKFRLMDECRSHPQAELLMQKDGPYAIRYAFPFCHVAVLSNTAARSTAKHRSWRGFSRWTPRLPGTSSRIGRH